MSQRRLRLLFLGSAASVHTQRWVSFFGQHHDVELLSSPSLEQEPWPFDQVALSPGSRSHRLPLLNGIRTFFHLRAALKRFRPHILHTHFLIPNAWLAYLSGFQPCINTIWGSDLLLASPLSRRLNTLALRHASLNTADADDLIQKMKSVGCMNEHVALIQFGVDTTTYFPGPVSDSFRAKLNIPSDAFVFFSPRAIRPLYNTKAIASAFLSIAPSAPNTHLVFLTHNADPSYLADVRSLLSQEYVRDRIHFCDYVTNTDMPELFRLSNVVISVPSSDGTAMSLLEAMASGCFPIVTNLPCNHEWLQHGATGEFVAPGKVEDLERAMCDTLSLTAEHFDASSKENREIVIARASQISNMEKMEHHYQRLAHD